MRRCQLLAAVAAPILAFSTVAAAQGMSGSEPLSSHEEGEPLSVSFGVFSGLCAAPDGTFLASDKRSGEIHVLNADGSLSRTLKPGLDPEAIAVAPDGTVYCGGEGQLAQLGADGAVVRKAPLPANAATDDGRTRRRRPRPNMVSGLAVGDRDVFLTVGSGWSTGAKAKLFRFDRDLKTSALLAEGLRGCCQRCDLAVCGEDVIVAENGAHRVVRYDRSGKLLFKWGERSRAGIEGFGSCCNPMNLCFDRAGNLYTAESGLGRIKKYAVDGTFIGLVGYVGTTRFERASGLAAACSNIALAANTDGSRIYVMDYKNRLIRVLMAKP